MKTCCTCTLQNDTVSCEINKNNVSNRCITYVHTRSPIILGLFVRTMGVQPTVETERQIRHSFSYLLLRRNTMTILRHRVPTAKDVLRYTTIVFPLLHSPLLHHRKILSSRTTMAVPKHDQRCAGRKHAPLPWPYIGHARPPSPAPPYLIMPEGYTARF